VADALRAEGARVVFVGGERAEKDLVPAAGYTLERIDAEGISRSNPLKAARAIAKATRAAATAQKIVRTFRPDVVLGGGGYVAGPMVLAARLSRIPAALTEADAHLGLANRLAEPFARRVFLAYAIEGRTGAKYRVTGRPVPLAHRGVSQEEGRRRFGLPPDRPVIAFFGALAGARSLNDFAVETYAEEGPAVLHISGARDYERLRERVTRDDYVLVASTDEFGAALAAPDLAISRAGGTVWELAAAGTPAILVPYPYATADHQTLNARHFERGGGAVLVPEPELDRVPALVEELLADRPRLDAMRAAMLSMARPEAADEVAEELIALAASR
jgi:UDP-N-acetylglucosamine--N-acetylmuramyl-(pentapeptide) pyrophosphoryl-undecaprenol N-acetylglucosamine transferase